LFSQILRGLGVAMAEKIVLAPSVRVIVIGSDHRLLWRGSYKGDDCALAPAESILHKIIIIILTDIICAIKVFIIHHGLFLSFCLTSFFFGLPQVGIKPGLPE